MAEILLTELNPKQREAVENTDGPLLILAGAGSGKTRVLTYRMAYTVLSGLATSQEILAVTFTNKAAREMEARTLSLLDRFQIPLWGRPWISTFHSSCVRILRDHIERLNYTRNFTIYDSSDQLSVIKSVVDDLGLDEKYNPPKKFQSTIEKAKMKGWSPDRLENSPTNADESAIEVYKIYEQKMKRANALDFNDLLLKVVVLFKEHPDVLEGFRNQFRYLMVDEYQDTNHMQYLLVKMLSQEHKNLCVVGDADQSIYSWRGADIANILDFEKDFPDAKVIKLEENYRSTQTIVKAASEVIKNNLQRKEKDLFTNNPSGEPICVREENNEYEEARFVVREIKNIQSQDPKSLNSSFAIFYRTNAQSRVLEEQLRSASIPYKIFGGVKFYDRMEVKDIIAYMKVLNNPMDDVALQRIINTPARGIGKTTVEKLSEFATKKGLCMLEALPLAIEEKTFNSSAAGKLTKFRQTIEELFTTSKTVKIAELYHTILDKTGYVQFLKEQDTLEAEARIQNLEELDNAIQQFQKERGEEASLSTFLEEIALVSDIDGMNEDQDSVVMMTLHLSKGLEFPYVFIVGMEEGIFPGGRSIDSQNPDELEEERRLAYVGMTRAEKALFLTHARSRKVWGADQNNPPSRFIGEIPSQYIKKSTAIYQPSFLKRYQEKYGSMSSESESEDTSSFRAPRNGVPRNTFTQKDSFPNYEDQSQADDLDQSSYQRGMKVRHPTFGIGTIWNLEGEGEKQMVSILFSNNHLKKFVVKYARLERA